VIDPSGNQKHFRFHFAVGLGTLRNYPLKTIARCVVLILLASGADADEHWSLQPVRRPKAPALIAPGARNPIDAFIDAELTTRGLARTPEADPGTVFRRLHFLLTGLPPTPENLALFLGEPSYVLWVERLLASPAYGERWARHWLDVVRFAETHGFEMNQPRESAWRYRDYVIGAFNSDKPYDQFVREQIAGDVYAARGASDADDATGFLVAGPWDQVKSPDPVLTANQRADELHDMVSTAGSAFLGLTVGCARCHNHKFDPIPQVDYFAMKAVFQGVEHGERERKGAAEERKAIEKARGEIARIDTSLDEHEPLAQPGSKNVARSTVNARRNVERFSPVRAKRVRFTVLKTSDAEPCIDELEVFTLEGKNVALASCGTKARASGTYPNSAIHRLEHINDGKYGNGRSWISDERGRGWVDLEFAETVTISRIVWGRDREEEYKDRLPLEYRIEVASEVKGDYRGVANSDDRAKGSSPAIETGAAPQLQIERKELLTEISRLEKSLRIYAGRFKDAPGPTHRLHRGDPVFPREVVQPGGLSAVNVVFREQTEDQLTDDQARRVSFADWATDSANPLTARVMVNRIWQYHFGVGLVSTTSDFGRNGASPSHPDLLDWLAAELVESGWSVKHLQRLIVSSATFRQGSSAHATGSSADAQNRLLWRFPPRRLEAEAIRDAILSVSGQLDWRSGGPGFSFFESNENYVRVYPPRDQWSPETFRRMIYGTVVRQRPDGVFGVFDCPDAGQIAPKRTSSTTPLQALNLLNSTFLLQQSRFFAERLERECGKGSEAQVKRAFALAFQRAPNEIELHAARELIELEGLPLFCRALLNVNEFVYLF
jgi:hypothetical protein